MSRPFSTVALGLSVLSAIGVYSLVKSPAAAAFTFNGSSVTIGASDISQSFKIDFGGNIETKNVAGLSSEATFTFLGFNSVGNKTEATFEILLANTSSQGITSRTSGLGFNVNHALLGVGSSNSAGNTRVSGLFGNDHTGSFPNQFGSVNVCFTSGPTCQGGSNGGVKTNETPGKMTATLAFSGNIDSFTLSNLGVRYQSINGKGYKDASGTGSGVPIFDPAPTPKPTPTPTPDPKPTPVPKDIPEPGTVGALLLLGLVSLRYGKKQ